jgi:hypothetical protein
MNASFLLGFIFLIFLVGGCSLNSHNQNEEMLISGNYQSVLGVMDYLSCFCFNAGYLTTVDNDRVPLCFQEGEEDVNCTTIHAKGYYQSKKINPEPTNTCLAGEMTLFYVSSHECA